MSAAADHSAHPVAKKKKNTATYIVAGVVIFLFLVLLSKIGSSGQETSSHKKEDKTTTNQIPGERQDIYSVTGVIPSGAYRLHIEGETSFTLDQMSAKWGKCSTPLYFNQNGISYEFKNGGGFIVNGEPDWTSGEPIVVKTQNGENGTLCFTVNH